MPDCVLGFRCLDRTYCILAFSYSSFASPYSLEDAPSFTWTERLFGGSLPNSTERVPRLNFGTVSQTARRCLHTEVDCILWNKLSFGETIQQQN